MPGPWLTFYHRLTLAAFFAGLSVAELWASLTADAAAAALQSLPDHRVTLLRLVALNGHRLDAPEEFRR